MEEACCTCATLLSNVVLNYDEKTEKPNAVDRRLDCCSRVICGNCIYKNQRFASYCPYCQISSIPQGLRRTPSYTASSSSKRSLQQHPPSDTQPPPYDDDLPSYSSLEVSQTHPKSVEKPHSNEPSEDTLHFLDHKHDTITSLSFRYHVPISAVRRCNGITSDHLLLARRTILIPGEYYKGGVSLSPRPIEGEEDERRKAMVRRWMVACKVAEYDVALLYLDQADYDLRAAVEAYKDDERWEKEHPRQSSAIRKGKTRFEVGRRRFTGQGT